MDKNLVLVKLGEYRGDVWVQANEIECDTGDYAIIEADKASEFGYVVYSGLREGVRLKKGAIKGKIVRKTTIGDLRQIENNRMKAKEAFGICLQKISEKRLDMRLVKCEYVFDSSKIIFFFTAEGRIDFRELVKELAKVFKVRIELKQIGVRDQSKMVSGYGVCGREFCCASYMRDFHPLSIKMAKDQLLPLNPSRISGGCGRIKCCMAYEVGVYKEICKEFPKLGDLLETPKGKGRVIDMNVLMSEVSVDLGEGEIVKMKIEKKDQKDQKEEKLEKNEGEKDNEEN